MPHWIHRTSRQDLRSVASADLPEPVGNYIQDPPNWADILTWPVKYRKITGDAVSEMNAAEKAAVDTAELNAQRDGVSDRLDGLEAFDRALALAVLDEFNRTRNAIDLFFEEFRAEVAAATNLGNFKTRIANNLTDPDMGPDNDRTVAQLKNVLRNKLGN